MKVIQAEEKTDLKSWLAMAEQLRQAPEWTAEELPIQMKQTHISVLLIGRNHVVKLKKPVDFGFLDYTTLKKRQQACEEEVRLNRRLCPDTYIGVGGVIEIDGQIRFSGRTGKIVDYCVWMKRLPDDRMLDQLVARNQVTEAMMDRVADRLREFHRTALRGPEVGKWASPTEIRHNWEENFAQTEPFIGRTINAEAFQSIRAWVSKWLEKTDLLKRRVSEGWIVDGHGDVRCESICVKDDAICIYDCIEFNDRFHCDDVASEAAFLAMDLDARGRPDLGYFFTEAYGGRTPDKDFFTLLPFYRCYRAFVRGKVLSFQLNETEFSEEEHRAATSNAAKYFELADRYASPLKRPTVIAVSGLSGTGKTSVARAIAGELGFRAVSSDAVRQSLFGEAKQPSAYGEGAYSDEATRLTYQKLIESARAQLLENGGVVLDATFLHPEQRQMLIAMAQSAGAECRFIQCQLAPELTRSRIAKRATLGNGLSDATWETNLRQREAAMVLGEEIDRNCLLLDTGSDLFTVAHRATDWLRQQELIGNDP